MKIRLLEPGFESFTGPIGAMVFENGLSTTDVQDRDFLRLSAVMKCEREDGTKTSPIDKLLSIADVGAPMPEAAREAELEANAAALAAYAQPESDKPAAVAPVMPAAKIYTEEQLSAIADSEGIKGLRKIADSMGIKSNSIKELMGAILEGQKA